MATGNVDPTGASFHGRLGGKRRINLGLKYQSAKYCMVLYYYISWYSDKPVCSSTHSDFKGGDFGNCPVALTHLAARNFPGNIVAIDLD